MLCVFCCHAPARQGLPKITMKALSPAPHNRSRPAIARPVSPGLQAPQRPALVPAPGGRARWSPALVPRRGTRHWGLAGDQVRIGLDQGPAGSSAVAGRCTLLGPSRICTHERNWGACQKIRSKSAS